MIFVNSPRQGDHSLLRSLKDLECEVQSCPKKRGEREHTFPSASTRAAFSFQSRGCRCSQTPGQMWPCDLRGGWLSKTLHSTPCPGRPAYGCKRRGFRAALEGQSQARFFSPWPYFCSKYIYSLLEDCQYTTDVSLSG